MRKLVVVLAAVLLMGVGAAVAWASIPGPDGVIHGCYKNSNPAQGALIAIDSAASCPSGYTALNWNQTGPQGPAGPGASITQVVKHYDQNTPGLSPGYGHLIETVSCPTGTHVLNGGVEHAAPVNAPEGSYPGAVENVNPEQGAGLELIDGLYYEAPRPVNSNTAWRLAVYVALANDYGTPTTFYQTDVTYFVVCS
jgi:hypothetical protein